MRVRDGSAPGRAGSLFVNVRKLAVQQRKFLAHPGREQDGCFWAASLEPRLPPLEGAPTRSGSCMVSLVRPVDNRLLIR